MATDDDQEAVANRIIRKLRGLLDPAPDQGPTPSASPARPGILPVEEWCRRLAGDLGLPGLGPDSDLLGPVLAAPRPNLRALDVCLAAEPLAGFPVPFPTLLAWPTPAGLVDWSRRSGNPRIEDPLFRVVRPGPGTRVVVLPTGRGVCLPSLKACLALPSEYEVVGLRVPTAPTGEIPFGECQHLVAAWALQLATLPPKDIALVGFSAAATLAYALATEPRLQAPRPATVLMLDGGVPETREDLFRRGPWIRHVEAGLLPAPDDQAAQIEKCAAGRQDFVSMLVRSRKVYDALRQATRLVPHPGPLHFLAGDPDPLSWYRDPELWALVAGRPVATSRIAAPHRSMLDPPHVDAVTAWIRSALPSSG